MINKKYLGGASYLLDELHKSVSPDDKIKLKKLFNNISSKRLKAYRDEVSPDIFKFIKATPEQRNMNPEWKDPEYRLKLLYFSFESLQRGYLLMTRLAALPKKTSNGDAYRTVTAVFSSLVNTVCSYKLTDSLFDEKLSYQDYN